MENGNNGDVLVVDSILVKPMTLTNRIINKKVQLGESAIIRMASMRSKKQKTMSIEKDDESVSSSSSSSASSSGSSFWSNRQQLSPDDVELVYLKTPVATNAIEHIKADKRFDSFRRRKALTKDDTEVVLNRGLLSASMKRRKKHKVFRSLRHKMADSKEDDLDNQMSRFAESWCKKSLDEVDDRMGGVPVSDKANAD